MAAVADTQRFLNLRRRAAIALLALATAPPAQ